MSAADDLRDALRPRLAAHDAPLLLDALRQLATGAEPTERAALLTVLGRAFRHHDLFPHADLIAGAAGSKVPAEVMRPGDDGPPWWPAEVIAHDRPCDTIAILTVRPWRRLPHRPGQAVPVCTPRQPGRWRWLSPANAPRPDGTFELHVRAVPAGSVSRSLVHEVRPGELLHLGPPRDTGLHLRDGDLLLIAGGTGLAPLRSLVEQVVADPADRRVTLVVGARTFTELYDAITLDQLQRAHDWLTIVPALSHDPWAEETERGDALTIAENHHRQGQDVLVCGPPAMLAGARLRLLAAGVLDDRIHLPKLPEA
ncbi:FAD-binding oxidoreductase [Micromonospora sp. NPDC050200]|uniref:FAD-binding oxidoreductase n=1 Tax=Micromonospora sp. NPDC050200 TaxID=3155664 RepID=UPI0033E5D612